MNTERSVAVEGSPDHPARQLIVITAVLASAVLLVLHEGIAGKWSGFDDPALWMLGYTLAIGPPLMLMLMIERIGERFTYAALGLLALLLAGLAWHTGGDCLSSRWGCSSLSTPYWATLATALFILLPFLEAWRDAGSRLPLRLSYSSLYRHAWDNALALAGTGLFVLAAWLILWLWGALFALLGITEFRELFGERRFIYPVTGLLVGFGLVMSRAQGGALRALLRLCLSLARALLPFVALLALLFLAVVVLRGPEALWQTRRAASLLLWLVLAMVVFVNGVYQDGNTEPRYPRWLQRFVSAGLLSLPAHAGLAIWAIVLRVDQHGWTPDRLSALLVAVILALHALLLAWAVLPARDGRWLSRLSVGNPLMAGFVVVLLLASQSPLLDFRSISVSSQLGRLARGELRIDGYDQVDDFRRRNGPGTQDRKQAEQRPRFDVRLFARELGREGRSALETLRTDPRHAGDLGLLAAIDEALSEPEIDVSPPSSRPLLAEDIETLPAGTVLPPELLSALAADLAPLAGKEFGPGCQRQLRPCMLISVDLGGPPGPEWLFVPPARSWNLPPLVYGASGSGGWLLLAWVYSQAGAGHPLLPETLREGRSPIAVASDWPLLQIGDHRYPIVGGRPDLLMSR
ncbi:DUF4153 domain-containing protein [Nevskia sp.]|uniref:DUF4153 domain-containing protein n=1 Tax=Nevskia sp. TaxID=1929292 RepID=UPI0025DEEBA4|nr:DUF4153 domain-containing protein [Nevskia sp.]